MKTASYLLACLVLALANGLAFADGMIVPIRPEIRVSGAWAVKYHHVKMNVRDQVASVSIDQEFENIGSGMIEVEYMFPVPPDAAIDSMTLIVNGKEFAAKLYKADEARKIYEDIVRTKKDPALLEYVGFGMLKTRAFPLEPGKPAHVIITYKTVCKKDRDLVQVWYPLNTEKFSAKPVQDVEVAVNIESKADVTTVYSPSHDLSVERKGPREVRCTYKAKNVLPTTDFQVFYKEADEEIGANLMTCQPTGKDDGYFMMLVSPNPRGGHEKVVSKDVVIVLDHSGSMSEESKLDQAKDAMKYVLKNLNADDRFNVVSFNDDVEQFFKGMTTANEKNVKEATERLDRVEATGGTNIDDAMSTALGNWSKVDNSDKASPVASRPKYVIFLTDGRPTVGKTDEDVILKDIAKGNACGARIFAFGVGYDVNVRLLDRLVLDNSGRSDYVKPKEPIEAKISSFYAKIRNPIMTDLKVEIAGLAIRDMYPRKMGDLFDGDQITLVGRYFAKEAEKLPVRDGKAHAQLVIKGTYEGKERAFEYPVDIQVGSGANWRYDFVEKLWAVRRVGFLMDQIQLSGQSKEIIDELVRLSKDYGIMTPYTSFLADERTDLSTHGYHALDARAGKEADKLSVVDGEAGQRGAMARQMLNEEQKSGETTLSPNLKASRPAAAPGALGASGGSAVYGNSTQAQYEAGKKERVATVQNVGNQTLYRRGQVWLTPEAAKLDLEKDKDKIQEIKRYSDEYFKLVRANTVAQNQLLATQAENEELVVDLRGQVYRIR